MAVFGSKLTKSGGVVTVEYTTVSVVVHISKERIMQIKTRWMSTLLAVAIVLLFTAGVAPVAQGAQMTQAVPTGEQEITVLGYGEAISPADTVLVRLSIPTQPNYSPTGSPEFTPVDEESMQIVVDALIENDITATEITTNTSAWSTYTGSPAAEVRFFYAEPANLNTFLAAVQETLEDLRGPSLPVAITSFRVDDCLALESEAWQVALDDARQRAEHVAALMEAELGRLVTVTELEPTISAYGINTDGGGCIALEADLPMYMPMPTTNSASAVKVVIRLQASYTFE
jgi:uncharacterized protein YggE